MDTIPNINEILAQQNLNKKGPPPSQEEIQNKIAILTQTINSKVLCGPDCQQNQNCQHCQHCQNLTVCQLFHPTANLSITLKEFIYEL